MERVMVSAAARIGYALGTSGDVEWGEVFGRMSDAIPDMCAVQVTGWDPVGRSHLVIAEYGYQKAISDDLCTYCRRRAGRATVRLGPRC
ncbi:hypothetical protein [Kibdelosporangium phytohabitans]|uniref:hypothetical protein n=1 Tax=Kibdelosporangium phytohabitans TaxID=860235 RepID=UPI0019EECAD0|nr:hypothetical protein [Kibdelosporangium phytohabitans]MBE1461951.1 hypothetical protein [Kibdelosporangium phytohabitans]